ncbi:membrane-associated transporter protein-like [Glandiceps talaboti]
MDTCRGIISYSRAYCTKLWDEVARRKLRDEDRIPITGEEDLAFDRTRKSRLQLLTLSAAVCGIEFCYAAETAYVSPTLLKIGVPEQYMTLIWCLSPLMGFFLMPFLGSGSDRCKSRLGRRRPFILLLSAGIILGLIFVPNGKDMGLSLGDKGDPPLYGKDSDNSNNTNIYTSTYATFTTENFNTSVAMETNSTMESMEGNTTTEPSFTMETNVTMETTSFNLTVANDTDPTDEDDYSYWDYIVSHHHLARYHLRGIIITVIGVVLLDFSADACQAPCRAYLLDVSVPEDHVKGLAMFTLMAGFGGCLGYIMGGIDWTNTSIGRALGTQVRVVFTFVLLIFSVAVTVTVTSTKEIPLCELEERETRKVTTRTKKYRQVSEDSEGRDIYENQLTYGTEAQDTLVTRKSESTEELEHLGGYQTVNEQGKIGESIPMATMTDNSETVPPPDAAQPSEYDTEQPVTMKTYLMSIIYMPYSLRILCLTNLFCWMSLVCYSLYFTDFVGQAVYGGDPKARIGSAERLIYEDGVRMGCWGMAVYSISCCIYCVFIEKLVYRIGAKPVYISNILFYSVGMAILAIARTPAAVIVLSITAGVMYATIFTMPFLILAHYHSSDTVNRISIHTTMIVFEKLHSGEEKRSQVRGLGTDISMVQSMVFLAQFFQSICMGSIVHAVQSTVAVVVSASLLSFCGAIAAWKVVYLDL